MKIEFYENIVFRIAGILFFSPLVIPILLGIFVDSHYFILLIIFFMGGSLCLSWGFGLIADFIEEKIYKNQYYETTKNRIHSVFGDM